MGRYRAYQEYCKTDSRWCPSIPSTWKLSKVGFHAFKIGSGKTPKGGSEVYSDNGILFIRSQNVHDEGLRLDDVVFIDNDTDLEMANSRPQEKDILLNITGASLGRSCIVPPGLPPANVNQHVCVIRPDGSVDASFFSWLMKSAGIKGQIESLQNGAAREGLNYEQVSALSIAVPLLKYEQRDIAAFLDHETSKIDRLIAKQEELIELLKEKRQAVISHAVTKGLNPDAPMKDSGVEWLGEIPAHWDVVSVAYRYEIQLGKMLDTSRISGEHLRPYLRVFDVQWGKINVDDLPVMDFDEEDQQRFRLRSGDLLVNEGGSYVGRSAIWNDEIDECYYQKALHRLRPISTSNDTSRFFYYVMCYATNLGVFVAGGNQATIEHLTAESFRRYRFGFPSLSEQSCIADILDAKTAKLDSLIAKAQRAVELFKERRTALISAAVTGKIDVSDWKPTEPSLSLAEAN